MKVGELKKILADIDDNIEVLAYSSISEDGDAVYGASLYKNSLKGNIMDEGYGKGLPYVKGDWPQVEEGDEVFIIGSD